MKNYILAIPLIIGMNANNARAEEKSVTTDFIKAGNDLKKGTKKGFNQVKEKGCELVNGKMTCLGRKIKHRATESIDEIKDKTKDLKK